ncbi:hypothetical protein MAHJHV30_18990 [Mycobacterium avium subsp. hominissuis]
MSASLTISRMVSESSTTSTRGVPTVNWPAAPRRQSVMATIVGAGAETNLKAPVRRRRIPPRWHQSCPVGTNIRPVGTKKWGCVKCPPHSDNLVRTSDLRKRVVAVRRAQHRFSPRETQVAPGAQRTAVPSDPLQLRLLPSRP